MKTIVFQGDSITDMMRDREEDGNRGIGYPTLVTAQLGMERPGEFRFLNRGIGGNRVIDLLARVKSDIINLKPDYLSILVGVNDVWHEYDFNNGVDTYWYEVYYDMLIQQVKDSLPQVKIMILEPFVLKGSETEPLWEKFRPEVENRAAAARRIAQKHGLLFVPLQEQMDHAATQMDSSWWLYDGVHPSPMGHEIIKRAWLKAFDEWESSR